MFKKILDFLYVLILSGFLFVIAPLWYVYNFKVSLLKSAIIITLALDTFVIVSGLVIFISHEAEGTKKKSIKRRSND